MTLVDIKCTSQESNNIIKVMVLPELRESFYQKTLHPVLTSSRAGDLEKGRQMW